MNGRTGAWLVLGLMAGSAASGAVATFDTRSEGDLGETFVDGGITFFELDDRAGPGPVSFSCERADGTLSGTGFTPPNVLSFSAWVPGPLAAFDQCGSFRFTTGSVQTFASVDVWEWLSPPGNQIWLEAYMGATLVNSTSVVIPGNLEINHWTLSVSGVPFDSLRVNGTGPGSLGTFIGIVDTVVVTPAPWSALGLIGLGAGRRRRQS